MLRVERLPGRPEDGIEAVLLLVVPSDLGLLDEAVDCFVALCVEGGEPTPSTRFRLRSAIAEAVSNAIARGNESNPSKAVAVRAELRERHVRVSVSDEGLGFDPDTVPDPCEPEARERPCGRGLLIIRHLADHVAFNAKGNTIWMTLPRW
jgi:serine/threonine-protein kinase RsbW